MNKRVRLGILCLLAFIVSGVCFSCVDEILRSTTYNIDSECLAKEGEKDMRLKVSVPRTYSSSGGVTLGREERIDTLDVLVFAPVAGSPTKFLRAAATGTPVKDEDGNIVNNVFEVIMPLGKDMDVHVFANSHYDLVRSGALGAVGTEMEALLGRITQNRKYDLQKSETLLPMHGSVVDITVDKDSKDVLPVSVLRSVAKVSAQLAGTVSDDGVLSGGELTEFKLRELYAFYPADSGRIATADTTQFYITKPDSGNVKTPTLPASLREGNKKDSLSIINTADVKQIESIYLYENRPWTKDEDDNATTRIVVGGIYTDPSTGEVDKDANRNPRVSYYRINLQDMQKTDAPVQLPFLRNHHYIFKINSVAAPGYDTPRQAADGKPINMNVTVIDWRNELHESIFDGENYFDLSEKKIVLPRYVNSQKSIEVESNVDVAEWKMYFKNTQNGVTTPKTWFKDKQGQDSIEATSVTTLQNSRYKVTKATNKITVEVLKNHSELPAGESREDTLILKVKNLRINIHISQKDVSADDWSNGGDLNTDLGEDPNKPIDVGLGFVVAKGNVVATKQADGSYTYAFAEEQGHYISNTSAGEYFCWNTLEPTGQIVQSSWDNTRDPCRKIDGGWYTPTKEQLQKLIDLYANGKSAWGAYIMKDGTKVNGRYFGISTVPSEVEQDKYVFLPFTGFRNGTSWSMVNQYGCYWSSTPSSSAAYGLYFSGGNCYFDYDDGRYFGFTVRCVRDK